MTQFYTDPSREDDEHALPDAEVFYMSAAEYADANDTAVDDDDAGYYYWPCFPGCLPDGDPIGPFATEAEAIADAQQETDALAYEVRDHDGTVQS